MWIVTNIAKASSFDNLLGFYFLGFSSRDPSRRKFFKLTVDIENYKVWILLVSVFELDEKNVIEFKVH